MRMLLRTVCGGLVVLSFFVLVVAIGRKCRRCKKSPALLVLNLVSTGLTCGLLYTAAAVADSVSHGGLPELPCLWLLYIGIGVFTAFKAATLCLACDQLSAVASPLLHEDRMAGWQRWMVAATWAAGLGLGLGGAAVHLALQPETVVQFDQRVFRVQHQLAECRWQRTTHLFIV